MDILLSIKGALFLKTLKSVTLRKLSYMYITKINVNITNIESLSVVNIK